MSFYSSSFCDSENPNDIDEGFNTSGSSQEDVEAEHSCSSSSLQPSHSREQDIHFSREDSDSQSNEDDIAVDDDLVKFSSRFIYMICNPKESTCCDGITMSFRWIGSFQNIGSLNHTISLILKLFPVTGLLSLCAQIFLL